MQILTALIQFRESSLRRWRNRVLHPRAHTRDDVSGDANPTSELSLENFRGQSHRPHRTRSQQFQIQSQTDVPGHNEGEIIARQPTLDGELVALSSMTSDMKTQETPKSTHQPLWRCFSPSVENFITSILQTPSDSSVSASSESSYDHPLFKRKETRDIERSMSLSDVNNEKTYDEFCANNFDHEGTEKSSLLSKNKSAKKYYVKRYGKGHTKGNKKKTNISGLTKESLNVVRPFVEKINENFICKVCMDRFTNVTFCPCGHYITCQECAEKLTECPVCRAVITHTVEVFQ